jgi:uncharacterized protein involved in exopolysaccharide biosynthesis
MSERELTTDDYVAMLRRRLKVILIPALVAPLTGFLVSYASFMPPRYTSTSTVLVEGQKVPGQYVSPIIAADFAERVQTLEQEILAPAKLRPMVHSLNVVKPEDEGKLIGQIQQTLHVEPVTTTMSAAAAAGAKKKPTASDEPVPGFNVAYTDDTSGVRAQKVCNALTSLIVDENLKSRSDVAQSTTNFLGRQLEDAKRTVDDQDAKLAAFKRQYMGQLPTDIDNNMRMLMSLNTQLDATTQTLARAQQDKTYAEGMLAQQIAAWKSSLSAENPQTLQQTLTLLRGQLLQLQARYTDDYPDVIKAKNDIAGVEKKLKEINAATAAGISADSGDASAANSEPPEIRQVRLQIHQYQNVIDQATQDQKKLQASINVYQARTAMSPNIEEEYKTLTRDNDTAQAFYRDLLAKKSSAELGTSMENQQEGEQMHIAATANLPESPSFPVRPLLAAAGGGVGLAFGFVIAIFLEFSDKSIRTEKDAAAAMDLPLLISVPWLGDDEDVSSNGNGRRRFWGRGDTSEPKDHEHVGV